MDRTASVVGHQHRFSARNGNGAAGRPVPPVAPRPRSPYKAMRKNLAAIAADSICLADLQFQLLRIDLQDAWERARPALWFCLAGVAVMLGALPVLLEGISRLMTVAFGISLAWSLVIVAAVAALSGGGLVLWSLSRLTHAAFPLIRSFRELEKNLVWLRSVLHTSDD